ncbi:MAG TPA: hypothetical protein QGF58_00980 [Myxococcota bacterium]|nr:hypothetical protein [Myxococcota bacterium]
MRWLGALGGYLLVVVLLTWPLPMGGSVLGYPNVDLLDTITLRGLFAGGAAYFPVGYPLHLLLPNVLDHALGWPLAKLLPFPLSDNLWWLLVLVGNGLAGHWMGWRLSGDHLVAAFAGCAWLCSDWLLREANLHHAPQALALFAPLCLAHAIPALRGGSRTDALLGGLFLGLASVAYWYFGLFLGVALLTQLRRSTWRRALEGAGVALLIAGPLLAWTLAHAAQMPLADPAVTPAPLQVPGDVSALPESMRFVAQHGTDPALPFRGEPLDRSNRVPLVLLGLAAAGLVLRREWRLLAMALTGLVFSLGPFLKLGEDLVLVGEDPLSLPFRWLGSLHPFLERLHWPERWGLLIPLGLIPLALRVPRVQLLTPLLVAEVLLLSGNAPLQTWDVSDLEGWRAVEAADGAVLELPLSRGGLAAPLVGLHARYHRRAIVNPLLLPPGEAPPEAWQDWVHSQPLVEAILELENGGNPGDPGPDAVRSLAEEGVGAIALDALPGSVMKGSQVIRSRQQLSKLLGDPEDHGCVLVWWVKPPRWQTEPVDNGHAWREGVEERYEETARPELNTLIEPVWNSRLGKEDK